MSENHKLQLAKPGKYSTLIIPSEAGNLSIVYLRAPVSKRDFVLRSESQNRELFPQRVKPPRL
jgi:hypothetical protein